MTSSMPSFEVKPIAGTIGAEILGVDLTQDLSADAFNVAVGSVYLHRG